MGTRISASDDVRPNYAFRAGKGSGLWLRLQPSYPVGGKVGSDDIRIAESRRFTLMSAAVDVDRHVIASSIGK